MFGLRLRRNLKNMNGLLIVFDSLRYDSAVIAETPNLDRLGPLRKAWTLSSYTPASHTAMFLGHLPSVTQTKVPYYNETIKQPWRITTGPARDAGKNCGMLFEGNNVIEGYRSLDYYCLGIGGVSQFSSGSFLRTAFPWSKFVYYGPDMDEEPLAVRDGKTFPLNHIEEIASFLEEENNWFLFINNPESHYPYDWGWGIPKEVEEVFPVLKKGLNLRSHKLKPKQKRALAKRSFALHQMQIKGLEQMDHKLGKLFSLLQSQSLEPIYVFACADHGENFGEEGLYGHMHATKECLSVPLWVGILYPNAEEQINPFAYGHY